LEPNLARGHEGRQCRRQSGVAHLGDRYTRYLADLPTVPGASAEAAAAAAARQILVQLYPNQKAIVEEAYATSLGAIPDGAGKSEGVALGERIAAAVQADRASDGTNVPDTYRPLTTPGVWVPTTPPLFAMPRPSRGC
jgi:hypothetical protein